MGQFFWAKETKDKNTYNKILVEYFWSNILGRKFFGRKFLGKNFWPDIILLQYYFGRISNLPDFDLPNFDLQFDHNLQF